MDEWWHLPAGHVEANEPACFAAVREAEEELGLRLTTSDLRLVHVLHHRSDTSRVGLFFLANVERSEVLNREPHKCAELRWEPLRHLPDRVVPYAAEVLRQIDGGALYSTAGWTASYEAA